MTWRIRIACLNHYDVTVTRGGLLYVEDFFQGERRPEAIHSAHLTVTMAQL